MKKLTACVLVFVLLLLCSCGKAQTDVQSTVPQDTNEETGSASLKLAYSKSDSLNPYECESQSNLQISQLVFDGLYELDSSYSPSPCIAVNSTVTTDSVIVNLGNVLFSDGSAVTVNDVLYSFKAAVASDYYSSLLENFTDAAIVSSSSIKFTTVSSDPYVLSCLTFPIVKETSDEDIPIGSGRYRYEEIGDNIFLILNAYKSSFSPVIKTIELTSVHDEESARNSLTIGNTGFFYDNLSSGQYTRLNANMVDMGINNLVFLTFNTDCEFFANADVRKAVSYAITREEIVSTGFSGHARVPVGPFNPDWYAVKDYSSESVFGLDKAKELIESSGIVPNSTELVLLYNSDNAFKAASAEIIEQSLEELGFIVTLSGVSSENIEGEIRDRKYDLYIGEVSLCANMSLMPLFSGDAALGYASQSDTVNSYSEFNEGSCELIDFINSFNEDMPFVPLCYRNAVVAYTNSMSADFICCDSDVFYDIDTWSMN